MEIVGVKGSDTTSKFVKNRKFGQKAIVGTINLGQTINLGFGKIGQNLFWLLVYI